MENDSQLLAVFNEEGLHSYDLVTQDFFIDGYRGKLGQVLHQFASKAKETSPYVISGGANLADFILQLKESGRLVASYDGVDSSVLEKLKQGIYRIPDSAQVGDQLRPCIVDDKNKVVKWLTLKEVSDSRALLSNCNTMAIQAALYQVSQKLDSISADVKYLIKFERRAELQNPFFEARSKLCTAASTGDLEYRKQQIWGALDCLQKGLVALYSDVKSSSQELYKLYSNHFSKLKEIDQYIEYIAEDICIIPKYVALMAYVYNYIGDYGNTQSVFNDFSYFICEMRTQLLGEGKKAVTLAGLLQMTFPYNKKNKDFWIIETEQLQKELEAIEIRKIEEHSPAYYLEMAGDDSDEQ